MVPHGILLFPIVPHERGAPAGSLRKGEILATLPRNQGFAVRNFIIVVLFMSGILWPVGHAAAAGLDTFARVNLVPGIEARLASSDRGAPSLDASGDRVQLTLAGPGSYSVDVQLSPLADDAPWSGLAGDSALTLDSLHDPDGNLILDVPLDRDTEKTSRYVLTLTYE